MSVNDPFDPLGPANRHGCICGRHADQAQHRAAQLSADGHGSIALRQSGFFLVAAPGFWADTQAHVAGQAVITMTAEGREARDDMVADLDRSDFRADLLDHP